MHQLHRSLVFCQGINTFSPSNSHSQRREIRIQQHLPMPSTTSAKVPGISCRSSQNSGGISGSKVESSIPPRVEIIMESDSDNSVMEDAERILNHFGVPHEVKKLSTPGMMLSYASSAKERGVRAIIVGVTGESNLPGKIAEVTPLSVIGVPVLVPNLDLDGIDSHLKEIDKMLSGFPMVGINNATNAGLLAVRILGICDADLLTRMSEYLRDAEDDVLQKDAKLQKDGWESYLHDLQQKSSAPKQF